MEYHVIPPFIYYIICKYPVIAIKKAGLSSDKTNKPEGLSNGLVIIDIV